MFTLLQMNIWQFSFKVFIKSCKLSFLFMYLHSFAKALSMCSSLGRLIFQDDVLKKRKKKCASHFMITSPAVGHRARLTCLNTSSPHSSFLCLAKTETFCFKCRTLTSQIVLRLCTFFFSFLIQYHIYHYRISTC